MSNESDPTSASAAPLPRRKNIKLFVAAGGGAAALALGAALWFGGVLSASHKAKLAAVGSTSHPVFVETPEMVTNLDAGPHRLSFVKVQCKLEVAQASDAAAVTASMPRLVDMIQTYLRETRPEELRSDAGTYRPREALLLRASLASTNARVKDVLFEELIVQ